MILGLDAEFSSYNSCHYSATVVSVMDSWRERQSNNRAMDDTYTYSESINVQYINSDHEQCNAKLSLTRDKEQSLPKEGESVEIEILRDGTISEYQPIRVSIGLFILTAFGMLMIFLGIFGKTSVFLPEPKNLNQSKNDQSAIDFDRHIHI